VNSIAARRHAQQPWNCIQIENAGLAGALPIEIMDRIPVLATAPNQSSKEESSQAQGVKYRFTPLEVANAP
jgi:hypothetical protein